MPRLVYQLAVSKDQSLHGYVNSSLSLFNVSDFQEQSLPRPEILFEFANVTECRYVSVLYHSKCSCICNRVATVTAAFGFV